MDANLKSLRTANPKKLGLIDLSPHYVSRRFAQLIASMIKLRAVSALQPASKDAHEQQGGVAPEAQGRCAALLPTAVLSLFCFLLFSIFCSSLCSSALHF